MDWDGGGTKDIGCSLHLCHLYIDGEEQRHMQRKMDPNFCGALGARAAGSLWATASSVGLGLVLRLKTTPVASSLMTLSEQ